MMVTFRFKNNEVLSCDDINAFTYKLNDEKKELEIYKNGEFLGYFATVYGISEEEFVKYIEDLQIEII